MLYLLILTLAFCSMAYELILAQSLSAFLENTVLRYSVTIGLYMFSMGIGAFLTEKKLNKCPILSLLRVEIFLTLIGGFSVIILHAFDTLHLPRLLFSGLAHGLIIVIGILTGIELPLLIEIVNKKKKEQENMVLAANYIGALAGTIIFAFIFYPRVGLIPAAFLVGFLNATSGLSLLRYEQDIDKVDKKNYDRAINVQAILLVIITGCWVFSNEINSYFIAQYLKIS